MHTRRIALDGLTGDVELLRDPYGIPHMRASSRSAAFFAQGYVAARDRMPQLESDRRRGLGRWAEVAGRIALGHDRFARQAGLAGAARRSFDALDPATREIFRCYAAGINAAFESMLESAASPAGLSTPPEGWERWEPWHSCLVYLVRHVWMGSLPRKLERTGLFRELPAETVWRLRASASDETPILSPGLTYRSVESGPPADWGARLDEWLGRFRPPLDLVAMGIGGSNSCGVGTRSATGRPLLAGDPHRLLEVPGPYWQNHLAADDAAGGFDAIGLSFPGVPGFPHFGHTAFVAWCITHAMADDQDIFVERLTDTTSRRETIDVAGADPVEIEIHESERGGIIAVDDEADLGLAFRWAATAEADTTFNCLLPMLTARGAAEFDEAMREWVVPVNNLLFADVHGDLRFRLRGRLPLRARDNGWSAVPGWDERYAWRGWVAFEKMPALRDPDEGLIVTANNRQLAAETPFVGHDFSASARADRILQLLRSADDLDRAAMEAVHADVLSLPAADFVAALDGVTAGEHDPWLDRLRGWDGSMEVDRVEPTIYAAIRGELCSSLARGWDLPLPERVVTDVLFAAFPAIVARIRAGDRSVISDWPQAVALSTRKAIESLTATLGPDPDGWRWKKVNQVAFIPAVAGMPVPNGRPVPGDGETIRVAANPPGQPGVTGASVARYVFDVGDWDNCGWVVVPDQLEEWHQARLVPMYYDWTAIPTGDEPPTRLVPK
jgi:penicillin G amidase